jgi:hypothetical protein
MSPAVPWIETCEPELRAVRLVNGLSFSVARLACLGGKVIAYNQRETIAQSEAGK